MFEHVDTGFETRIWVRLTSHLCGKRRALWILPCVYRLLKASSSFPLYQLYCLSCPIEPNCFQGVRCWNESPSCSGDTIRKSHGKISEIPKFAWDHFTAWCPNGTWHRFALPCVTAWPQHSGSWWFWHGRNWSLTLRGTSGCALRGDQTLKMGILQTELETQPGELLIWFWSTYLFLNGINIKLWLT